MKIGGASWINSQFITQYYSFIGTADPPIILVPGRSNRIYLAFYSSTTNLAYISTDQTKLDPGGFNTTAQSLVQSETPIEFKISEHPNLVSLPWYLSSTGSVSVAAVEIYEAGLCDQ